MRGRPITALALTLLLGAGCDSTANVVTDVHVDLPRAGVTGDVREGRPQPLPDQNEEGSAEGDTPTIDVSSYAEYTAAGFNAARKEGRPILLYFWASWCPICRVEEPKVMAIVASSAVPIAGFRVDFDAEKELNESYGVHYQHTTMILNGSGRETQRFFGPVPEADLRAAIAAAAN